MRIGSPEDFQPDPEILEKAAAIAAETGGSVAWTADAAAAADGADVDILRTADRVHDAALAAALAAGCLELDLAGQLLTARDAAGCDRYDLVDGLHARDDAGWEEL